MSATTHAASLSLTQAFNAVGTTATTITTAVDSIGQLANVANMHARRFADRTRKTMLIEAEEENTILVHETARKVINRLAESKKFLEQNPSLAEDYNILVDRFTKALEPKPATA